jgi:3-hydroxyisobutyrate dehydrogenase-like beta-hydroxyacid dehydrogenase
MIDRSQVGLLHPGSMGAAVGRQLTSAGLRVRWIPAGRSLATRRRAEDAGLEPIDDLVAMADACWLILSVCPPAAAVSVAESVAAVSFDGVYVDANAVSPARAREIAVLLAAGGAETVDGGIVGPPPGGPRNAWLCLSGPAPAAQRVAELFAGSKLATTVLTGPVGQASALKLAFASYNKISIALAAQANALATAFGVRDELRDLAGQVLPGTPLAQPEAVLTAGPRAWRWAPEMLEIAAACAEAGLEPDLQQAAARLFERWRDRKDDDGISLDQLLEDLRQP